MASQADCASYDIKESDWGAGYSGRVGEMSGCVRTERQLKDRKVRCQCLEKVESQQHSVRIYRGRKTV